MPRETKQQKVQRRASHAGFHFHNLFQCCPMKFFIKFLLRIEPKYTAVPLINGAAFHDGKATFYKTGSEAKALRTIKTEIRQRKDEFQYTDDYDSTMERCPALLKAWIAAFGHVDLKRFDFLAVEEEYALPVPNTKDFVFTVRPDTVVQEKTGDKDIYILETKTSSFSIGTTEIGVYYGDQATAYTWAVKEVFGQYPYGVIPDIAYWNKQSTLQSNIKCVRGDIIKRTPLRIAQYLGSVAQLQTQISQLIEAYKAGYNPYGLFPRNTFYCNAFFKPCEYAEVCDCDLPKLKRLPPALKKNRSSVKPRLNHYVDDICAGIL